MVDLFEVVLVGLVVPEAGQGIPGSHALARLLMLDYKLLMLIMVESKREKERESGKGGGVNGKCRINELAARYKKSLIGFAFQSITDGQTSLIFKPRGKS